MNVTNWNGEVAPSIILIERFERKVNIVRNVKEETQRKNFERVTYDIPCQKHWILQSPYH